MFNRSTQRKSWRLKRWSECSRRVLKWNAMRRLRDRGNWTKNSAKHLSTNLSTSSQLGWVQVWCIKFLLLVIYRFSSHMGALSIFSNDKLIVHFYKIYYKINYKCWSSSKVIFPSWEKSIFYRGHKIFP